jgi:hypothetical protein
MSAKLPRVEHLAKRFFGSLSRRPPPSEDEAWARSWLLPGEVELWERMGNADRRHVIDVARRFEDAVPAPVTRPAMAGALLHDIGKVVCGLGTYQRVLATVLGPGHSRGRYACYHRHEAIGAELCAAAGSDPLTVAMVGDEAGGDLPDGLLDALHAADDI